MTYILLTLFANIRMHVDNITSLLFRLLYDNVCFTDIRFPFSPTPPLTPAARESSDKLDPHRSRESFQFTAMKSGSNLYKQNVLSVIQFTKQQVCIHIINCI